MLGREHAELVALGIVHHGPHAAVLLGPVPKGRAESAQTARRRPRSRSSATRSRWTRFFTILSSGTSVKKSVGRSESSGGSTITDGIVLGLVDALRRAAARARPRRRAPPTSRAPRTRSARAAPRRRSRRRSRRSSRGRAYAAGPVRTKDAAGTRSGGSRTDWSARPVSEATSSSIEARALSSFSDAALISTFAIAQRAAQ